MILPRGNIYIYIYSEESWVKYRPLKHSTSQWHALWIYPIYTNKLLSLRKVRSKPLESHITDTKIGLQSRQKDLTIDGIKRSTEVKKQQNDTLLFVNIP